MDDIYEWCKNFSIRIDEVEEVWISMRVALVALFFCPRVDFRCWRPAQLSWCERCRLRFLRMLLILIMFVDAYKQPYLEEQNRKYWSYRSRRRTQLWLQVPYTDAVLICIFLLFTHWFIISGFHAYLSLPLKVEWCWGALALSGIWENLSPMTNMMKWNLMCLLEVTETAMTGKPLVLEHVSRMTLLSGLIWLLWVKVS